jgi:hypothetical protein
MAAVLDGEVVQFGTRHVGIEAHAAGGDTKHLMELFVLSARAAQRCTAPLERPDLHTPRATCPGDPEAGR